MTVVFASNYFNHHQKPFSDAMYALIGAHYAFIETIPMEKERLQMGWGGEEKPAYVKQGYGDAEKENACRQLIYDADVVLIGSAPWELVEKRLQAGKLTFKYSERIYKEGCPYYKLPWHFYLNTKKYRRYKNLYLLCASAYTAGDFAKTFTFLGKAYKWGYFPEAKQYGDVDALIDSKKTISILWAGRMIEWKHPEYAVEVAKRLWAEGYDFSLNMIGNGAQEEAIREKIKRDKLSNCVTLLGSMKPEEVRSHMEQSEIFLFTSDRNEGWGAVLNESMNSACAVVASHAIGSVPFLVRDGENGLVYRSGDVEDLYGKVKSLLDDTKKRARLAKNAYLTITEEWNAENAAKKLLGLCEELLAGNAGCFPYREGVCSKAERIKDNWAKWKA